MSTTRFMNIADLIIDGFLIPPVCKKDLTQIIADALYDAYSEGLSEGEYMAWVHFQEENPQDA